MTVVDYFQGERIKAERGPLVVIDSVERHVHGNGIKVLVFAELKIAAKETVLARELKLNTIDSLFLTPHTGAHGLYHVQKWISNPGQYDNYASIDILVPSGTVYEMFSSGRSQVEIPAPSALPEDGSIWLDVLAEGE